MCRTCVHLLPHFGQHSAIPRRVHSSCAALSPSSALRSRAVIVFRLRFPPVFGSICTPCAIALPQSHTYMRHSTLLRKRPFAFPIPCGIDRSSRNVRQPTAERFYPPILVRFCKFSQSLRVIASCNNRVFDSSFFLSVFDFHRSVLPSQ